MKKEAETHLVIDLGFGDCGKGLAVDALVAASPERSLVIRFSGGHQVGHTVCRGGRRHTFSNFGAGTFLGAPTYYLPTTTVFPPAMRVEASLLDPVRPKVLLHPLAMVTTPFDVALNRAREQVNQHGSCGVGFGITVERHLAGVCLFAKDLVVPCVAEEKLRAIEDYLAKITSGSPWAEAFEKECLKLSIDVFLEDCAWMIGTTQLALPGDLPPARNRWIMEGSQGILLDQKHGFFPHVTRANTTSENAFAFLSQVRGKAAVDIHYVTRCYQNRHGNGPMGEGGAVKLVGNSAEANSFNQHQGAFRTAELDPAFLRYALATDEIFHGAHEVRKHLLVTCLDHRPGFELTKIADEFSTPFATLTGSYGPGADTLVRI